MRILRFFLRANFLKFRLLLHVFLLTANPLKPLFFFLNFLFVFYGVTLLKIESSFMLKNADNRLIERFFVFLAVKILLFALMLVTVRDFTNKQAFLRAKIGKRVIKIRHV